jgi:iron(III) transport system ATP-binding protein
MTAALQCRELRKSFGAFVALHRVNLSVKTGQILTLLGPSGCGKTTTLRLIAGFEAPDSGQITIGGRLAAGDGVFLPPEKRRVGMLFQEYALFPHLNVSENIAFGLNTPSREKAARVDELLALVGLVGYERHNPHELSGGQQQRVALARALAARPDVVLLDEPFSNLDNNLRIQVRAEVRSIFKQTGMTCIFVTHDKEEAFSLSDEVAVMLNGVIAQSDTPQAIYRTPATREVAAFVGEAMFLPGEASGDTVDCALGTLPLANGMYGAVDVLIRPEMLKLRPDAAGNGLIQTCEFYGASQRLTVALDNGTLLTARTPTTELFSAGDRVVVELPVPVVAFKR